MDISRLKLMADANQRNGLEISPANPPKQSRSQPEPMESNQNELFLAIPDRGEKLQEAVAKLNQSMAMSDTRLQFSINDKTQQIAVKVLDVETGEVIREVPPQKVMEAVAMIKEQSGLLVDQSA